MHENVSARELLRQAADVYDSPNNDLARQAASAGFGGFASGARWMHQALLVIRGQPTNSSPTVNANFQLLGILKYGVASAAALAVAGLAIAMNVPVFALLAIPAFYAVEVQGVFLFPLVLDGSTNPFRDARVWTIRAGGTLRVMAVVMPIAATMLFGGFVGRGFVRSWCLGCLAVCLWYEYIRLQPASMQAA
jgi:hypothetical protein